MDLANLGGRLLSLSRTILDELAVECDLDGLGVAPAHPVPVDASLFANRVRAAPPELGYLARSLDRRLDPGLVLPGVQSVVTGYVSYAPPDPGSGPRPSLDARVAAFARFEDYHKTVGARFARLSDLLVRRFGARTRWYVDTGPVPEKAYAVAAGLGFIGKNTLFVSPRHGSFVFLGVVLTDLEGGDSPVLGQTYCKTCRACQDACPARALETPYVLDVSRCLAHRTVTARTAADLTLTELAGNCYGCDRCQEVCPFNRAAERPARPDFLPLSALDELTADRLLDLDDAGLDALVAGTPMRRRDRELLRAVARRLAGRSD